MNHCMPNFLKQLFLFSVLIFNTGLAIEHRAYGYPVDSIENPSPAIKIL